jgi:hypothetical protein
MAQLREFLDGNSFYVRWLQVPELTEPSDLQYFFGSFVTVGTDYDLTGHKLRSLVLES